MVIAKLLGAAPQRQNSFPRTLHLPPRLDGSRRARTVDFLHYRRSGNWGPSGMGWVRRLPCGAIFRRAYLARTRLAPRALGAVLKLEGRGSCGRWKSG